MNDLNIEIPLNSIVSIIGLNGSGKTSLLKCLNSLAEYDGEVIYKQKNIKDYELKEKAKQISYLPQTFIIPNINVKTLVGHGRFPHLEFGRKFADIDIEKVENAVELTNIKDLQNRKVASLSGGQRQRVYLAMAIAQDTETLLLDEPTTYLDIHYQLEIFNILLELKKLGKSVIMVLHDLQQAFSYSDYIVLMDKGEVVTIDTPINLAKQGYIKNIFGVKIIKSEESDNFLYPYIFVKE